MSDIAKKILTVLAVTAVMIYTFFNYTAGKMNTITFLIFAGMLLLPTLNIIRSIFDDLRNN